MREPGFREAFSACRADNLVSIHGILRAGFSYETSVRVWGILNGRIRFRRRFLDSALRLPDAFR
jgi:RimJ/RimL family protein N-acetyltransferase